MKRKHNRNIAHVQMEAIHYSNVIMGATESQIICLMVGLLNRLFRCITGLCAGNSPVTGEFSAQRDSNAENVSI